MSYHYDLAVLRAALSDAPTIRDRTDWLETIMVLIDRQQEELQMQAIRLGERVYVEKPKTFVRRIRGYWEAWRPGF